VFAALQRSGLVGRIGAAHCFPHARAALAHAREPKK
jgi:hypothetical protein